ncbi:MAG: hypothetical protein H6719_36000 [Sandaracinaceae bacterium]|nr:hypothetical protein [Sandaracinaceae bacterium]
MRVLCGLACLLVACGSDPASTSAVTDEDPPPSVDPVPSPPSDPPDPPTAPDPDPSEAPAIAPEALEGAPEEGCEVGAPTRVFTGDAWVDVAATEDAFVVAGVSRLGDGEHAFAASVTPGAAPRLIARRALEADAMSGHRRAGPALAIAGSRAALLYPDGERHLVLTVFDPSGEGPLQPRSIAEGASLQFAPALAWRDQALLAAWTDQEAGGRRVFATRVTNGRAAAPVDLSPSAGGAASPTFVADTDGLRLIYVDAREATSVIHRVDASGDAYGAPEVLRAVSLLTDPPHAASVRMRGADWLVYTGIGAVATTAVGLVALTGSQPPTAVVSGTGYGVLYVGAASFGDGAVIVADVPTAAPAESPREVQLRTVDGSGGLQEPVTLRGPRGTAARVRVAVRGVDIAVAFADTDGAYVAFARCAVP